jgi:hypothetical protein
MKLFSIKIMKKSINFLNNFFFSFDAVIEQCPYAAIAACIMETHHAWFVEPDAYYKHQRLLLDQLLLKQKKFYV